jgi:serine/threonine protein kinase
MFEPGTQVGRYEIQRRLGRGGMGTVYVAHDPVLGRMVAIKVFAGDLDMPDARERFSREARAAAALSHPNIVTVYDFGEFNSQPYIVMEYVPGETLATIIRRKAAVSMADKLRWMEELCAGAGYAHQMSVVHRDIKPANLILDRAGRLKILDFGIARMLGIASNTSVMIGTPGYMAPEQITGDPVDHRSDQFSIGVVFYELLSYVEPFPGDTLPMITHRIVSQEPTPLDQLVPDASPDLIAIVTQALKKTSAQRFKDTDSMRIAISRIRRRYESESDSSWNVPTMPPGRDSHPTATGNRGTGSARRRSNDSVGVAQLTPPPDPRRTDREALARRRTAQVDASLVLARTLFEQRDFEGALEACQQALTLDESHAGALELESDIQTAIRSRDGLEVAADEVAIASEGPTLIDPGLARSRLLESQAITRYHEDQFAVTGLPPASVEKPVTRPPMPPAGGIPDEKTAIRLPAAAPVSEKTIIAPPRRTPAPAVPASPAPAAPVAPSAPVVPSTPVASTPSVAPAAAKPAPVPAKASTSAPAKAVQTPVKKERADVFGPVLQAVSSAVQGVSQSLRGSVSSGKQNAVALWAGAGVLALVVVGGAVFMLTGGSAPAGTAIIDAVPWATITAVTDAGGEAQPLPASATTPMALTLPAGTYQITLTGPAPESKTQTVSVTVEAGATTVVPLTQLQSMSVDEYFEQYIGAGDAPAASAEPPSEPAATGVAQ